MLFRCIFNTSCILPVCYIIYFIYVSHVALSYFAAFRPFSILCARLYLSSNKSNLILQNVYRFFAYDRVRFHFLRELPCLSLDLLPVSRTSAFYLLPRRKRDITSSLLPSFDYWRASRIESSLPRQVDYTLEVVVTVFSSLALIPHGTKRWI